MTFLRACLETRSKEILEELCSEKSCAFRAGMRHGKMGVPSDAQFFICSN